MQWQRELFVVFLISSFAAFVIIDSTLSVFGSFKINRIGVLCIFFFGVNWFFSHSSPFFCIQNNKKKDEKIA